MMNTKVDPYASDNLKPLTLTEDEAMVLLELCLYSKVEDDPIRAIILTKVSALCKEFIRPDSDENLDFDLSPQYSAGANFRNTI